MFPLLAGVYPRPVLGRLEMRYSLKRTPRFRTRQVSLSIGIPFALFAVTLCAAPEAQAGIREEIRTAYDNSVALFNELEFDAAQATVEEAISAAEAGDGAQDPTLAVLFVVQAALHYSTVGDDAAAKILASLIRATTLNYYVVVPLEMRSEGLNNYLKQARDAAGGEASEAIRHVEPEAACGADLVFDALLGVPDGGQAALYWRPIGAEEFLAIEMPVFSNVARAVIPAADHADADLEYFIFAFDATNQPVANKGTQAAPVALDQSCVVEEAPAIVPVEKPEPVREPVREPVHESTLPRGWINLGFGIGFGTARGEAEHTWQQFDPEDSSVNYGAGHAGCAIARWHAGGLSPNSVALDQLGAAFEQYGIAGGRSTLERAWNDNDGICDVRHPVSGGFGVAPFHIEPELSFRVGDKVALGVFGRLQLATGSKLSDNDPRKTVEASFRDDVRSSDPQGIVVKPDFTWAAGVKLKVFLGDESSKFRPFVGVFGGYGRSRLRVDLGFSNDLNGNSVPDDREVAFETDADDNCYPVWPYNGACEEQGDVDMAASVRANASGNRIDTVAIGPVFGGGLFGFNYQLHKNFAIFGELQVGAWFPKSGSLLFDLNVGPAITF